MIDDIVKKLEKEKMLSDEEFFRLFECENDSYLFECADRIRRSVYSDEVYIRGLIEITNYCKNNCYYCGIRCGNTKAVRYRLSKEQILEACDEGYELGFRTFVMQGGEDPYFDDKMVCDIVSSVKEKYPECAVTLSIGEKPKESYKAFKNAGADRYLLRHETATDEHYSKLHPSGMLLSVRKQCLYDLKELGFQVGAGFMVGSPWQTKENIASDLRFLKELQPDMIGIGPFLSHKDTPFASYENGSFELTLRLVAILRILFPYALIPSTTALGTIHPQGREMGLKAGANVVMPNLSPLSVRKLYMLYDNKISTDEEAAQNVESLKKKVADAGYRVVTARGDVKEHPNV